MSSSSNSEAGGGPLSPVPHPHAVSGDGAATVGGSSTLYPTPNRRQAQRPSADDDGMIAEASMEVCRRDSFSNASSAAAFVSDDDEEVSWYEEQPLASAAFPAFEEIRREGRLCDVTLVAGGGPGPGDGGLSPPAQEEHRFSAHRVVLAATVPYFRGMFCSDMIEQHQTDIHMRDMDADTLEQLINFAYSGRVRISTSNVQSLMVGASFLSLNNIVEACCRFLTPRLQGSNVLTVRQFASALHCESLRRAADRFLQKHFVAVSRTDDLLRLAADDLEDVLKRDQLYVTSEEQVLRCWWCNA